MTAPVPFPDDELAAAVDEVFLGYWPADLMAIVDRPYEPGALQRFAAEQDPDGGAR